MIQLWYSLHSSSEKNLMSTNVRFFICFVPLLFKWQHAAELELTPQVSVKHADSYPSMNSSLPQRFLWCHRVLGFLSLQVPLCMFSGVEVRWLWRKSWQPGLLCLLWSSNSYWKALQYVVLKSHLLWIMEYDIIIVLSMSMVLEVKAHNFSDREDFSWVFHSYCSNRCELSCSHCGVCWLCVIHCYFLLHCLLRLLWTVPFTCSLTNWLKQ